MSWQFQGPKNASKYYIACQAPMASTVIDFWRMIWEQQSRVILMLTDLVENGVVSTTRLSLYRHKQNGVIIPAALSNILLADAADMFQICRTLTSASLFLWFIL
jgi:protein tyrosine phosphatase